MTWPPRRHRSHHVPLPPVSCREYNRAALIRPHLLGKSLFVLQPTALERATRILRDESRKLHTPRAGSGRRPCLRTYRDCSSGKPALAAGGAFPTLSHCGATSSHYSALVDLSVVALWSQFLPTITGNFPRFSRAAETSLPSLSACSILRACRICSQLLTKKLGELLDAALSAALRHCPSPRTCCRPRMPSSRPDDTTGPRCCPPRPSSHWPMQ
jgi:hypothetical protein